MIDKDIFLNFNGSSQYKRYSRALSKGYINIDEKTFEDNLVYAYTLSKLFHYYDLNGNKDGDWSEFLLDEAIILAAITYFDPSKIESKFKKQYQKILTFTRPGKKLNYLIDSYHDIYAIAFKINTWYDNLKVVEDFTHEKVKIRNEISNIILTRLSKALQRFRAFVLAASDADTLKHQFDFNFSVFSDIWDIQNVEASKIIYGGTSKVERIDNASEALQIIFQEFYEATIYLKQKSHNLLKESLKVDQHFPENALLLAFLDLYKIPQEQINGLSKKYLDYYYRNILLQNEKGAEEHKSYLAFNLENDKDSVLINKNTSFIAGADNTGQNILFNTDYDIEINKAKLVKLVNIFLERQSLHFRKENIEHINNIYSSELQVETWKDKTDEFDLLSFPTFGESQQGRGDNDKTMSFSDIGIAIASPTLFLKEGDRAVDVILNIKQEAYEEIINRLNQYSKYLNLSLRETTVKCFLEAFKIDLTAIEGWYQIERYVVILDDKTSSIVIKFDIPSNAPSIVGYNMTVHAGNYNAKYPIVRIILNNHAYLYPYYLLQGSVLDQIAVKATVKRVRSLYVHNNFGPVNIDNPFFPFGPMPKLGSYMLLGSNEIFQKHIDNFRVNIEWYDLPKTNRGMSEWYEAYNLKVDNTSYKVSLSILDDGQWKPMENEKKQILHLYRTENKPNDNVPETHAKLSPFTSFQNIDMHLIKQNPAHSNITEFPTYNNLSKRGFIKLELIGPENSYAHDIYPNILSETTINNSKTGFIKGKTKKPVPNAPITPQIKTISVDYETSAIIPVRDNQQLKPELAAENGKLFHIHPFGIANVFPNKTLKNIDIIPEFFFQGAMYLGFKDIQAPQTVSVLFEMLDEFTISSEEEPPVIEWSFLADNIWYPIKPSNILRDDTNGFLKTGIVMIQIPEAINKNNSILQNNLFWIKVSVKNNIECASNLLNAISQVVTSTLTNKEKLLDSDFLNEPLKPYTIKRSLKNLQGIKSVIQPLASYSGKPIENKETFYARTGERLRHRKRAVTNWDYERLILDEFPHIERATCLPNMTSTDLDAPGNILIVISPFPDNVLNKKEPRASSELLYEIKSYITKHSSPFTNIEVRNPSYERIRVICSVKFTTSHNHGFFIQKLNENINEYLSGNLGGDSHGSLFGKIINKSDLLTYIRTLSYVQFITSFSMIQAARDITGNYVLLDTAQDGDSKSGLKATKPWSVLVPADQHQITVLIEKQERDALPAGIDFLELGNDFIIND